MRNNLLKLAMLLALCGGGISSTSAQCGADVPSFAVDLTSSPSATYMSPAVVRNGYCCGVTGNDQCIQFSITLHPDAQGFNFAVCEGAVPPGALYYQIGCGPLTPIGTPICLDGVGPHVLTFCKPGNNTNRYCITSIMAPAAGPSITLNEGCSGTITSTGFAPGSTQWTSVYPGATGAYNNYLSCPTCPTTNVTGQAGYPPYVDYRICGFALSPCSHMSFCDTVRVFFNSTLLAPIVPAVPTVCFGATGTTITVNASGGTPPYTYLWNNGQTTPSIYVGPGVHTVQVFDNSNCPAISNSVTVTQFTNPITASAGTDIVTCGANTTTQLAGSVTGVTTGIWSGGGGQFNPGPTALNATYSPTATEVATGFVDLTLTTTNNGTCPGHQDVVRVHFDPGVLNGTVNAINATCNGVANGSATFSSPTPGLTYYWSNGQTTATATGLGAGNYTVIASTPLGCSVTRQVTITQPAALAVANMQVVNESCAGAGNGSVTVNVTGGTQPYGYAWNVPGNGSTVTGTTGNYTVTVTDANGCAPVQGTASIQANAQPNVANAGPDLIGCQGALPVQLQGTVTNATGGYWSGGNGTFSGTGLNAQYQPTATEIQNGSVTLTLTTTGNTNCATATDQATITLSNSFLTASLATVNASCNGGQNGSLTYSPALPGMTWQWQGMPQVTGSVASGLAAGNYQLQVTDDLGCFMTLNGTVGQPAALAVASVNIVNESCLGSGNGSATVNVTGGTPPYNYVWNVPNTGPTYTGTSGTYTVYVSDANNCTAVQATAVIGANAQPNSASAGPDVIGCYDALPVSLQGTVTNATGGIWSGGNGTFIGNGLNVQYQPTTAEIQTGSVTLTLTTTGNTNCATATDQMVLALSSSFINASLAPTHATCNGALNGSLAFSTSAPGMTYQWQGLPQVTGPVASGLGAGTYSLLVTDLLGCTANLSATITQPAVIAIAGMSVINENCAGMGNGSATVTAMGGTQPYSYVWNVPNTGPTLVAPAGQYTVLISDANGCIGVQGTATIGSDAQPNTASAGPDVIACQGQYPVTLQGEVTNATGGSWSGGNGVFIANGLTAQYHPSTGEIQSGSVTLTFSTSGNNNCPGASDQATIQFSNSFLNASLTTAPASCNGHSNGMISFAPVSTGLVYQWQGMPQHTGSIVNGLAAGSYTLVVTDQLGCSATYSATIGQPSALSVLSSSSTPVSCNGYTDGIAGVAIQGGVPPYAYQWTASAGSQTGSPAGMLAAGTHGVTVTDANGCQIQTSITVTAPPAITLTANVPATVCANTPVQLSATATGGTGALTIQWPGIGNGQSVTHSFGASQDVIVTVTDVNNCPGPVLTFPLNVLDLQAATLETYGDTTVCPGGYTYVGATLEGYTGDHQITWPQLGLTGNGPFYMPITATTDLVVQIVDQCAQTISSTIHLGLETPPVISLPSLIARGCAPLSVQMPSNLTTQQVSYEWQFGNGMTSDQQTPTVVFETGTYEVTLTVTTPLGCSASSINTGQVIAMQGPTVSITADPVLVDIDNALVHFTSETSPGVVYNVWTFGDGGTSNALNPSHQYTQIGSFPVVLQVQDASGCTGEAEVQVMVTPVYDITVPNVFTPDLSGGGSGAYHPQDLSNDVFYPFIRYVEDYRMRIFNRWGELIFETDDLKRGWDGYYRDQLSPQDVYVYQLWVRFVDGREKQKIGDITLLR